jgi:predicted  nucleic acid-binding Zn-ribbon protein
MSPDLDRLIALQQLDTAIDDARRRIAAHPGRLAEAEARLAGAREAVEREKGRLKENHDARRALEKDAAVFQSRVTKFKDQLSAVKTNREYQAIQVEIETAQRELGEAEEKVLERMMEADAIGADIRKAEGALAAQEKEVSAEKSALARELSADESRLARDTEARTELLARVEPQHLRLFEQVARARKGVAICSATRDGLCSVCHVRLRPQVFQLVRQNDAIIQCDSCQRILYYVPPAGAVEPPVTHPA